MVFSSKEVQLNIFKREISNLKYVKVTYAGRKSAGYRRMHNQTGKAVIIPKPFDCLSELASVALSQTGAAFLLLRSAHC